MSRILMVTHGSGGDIIPFVRLAAGLIERGHEPVLLTHQPYESYARRIGAEFVPIDNTADYAGHMVRSTDLLRLRSPADLRLYYEQNGLFDQLRLECDTLAAWHRPGDTVLVGRYSTGLSVLVAAEVLDAAAAWVAVSPTQLITSRVSEFYITTGLGPEIDRVRAAYGLEPVTDFRSWLRSARLTLGLWPEWFDAAGSAAPPGVQVAGFVAGDELGIDDSGVELPEPIAALLGGPESPVLVTGGTGRALHEQFYPVAVAAAARLGRPALVVTPYPELLREPLPPTMTWVPRVSFLRVLPHCAAIVHHGGIGTAMRALRAGVPQVIMAHGMDRPDNASRLAKLELAQWTQSQDWTVPGVCAQLRDAVADTGYRVRARTILMDDDAGTAVATVVEALESLRKCSG